jgi:hypothetical protein
LFIEKPREEKAQQIDGDTRDRALGRQIHGIQPIDPPDSCVGGDQFIGQLSNSPLHKRSIVMPAPKRKAQNPIPFRPLAAIVLIQKTVPFWGTGPVVSGLMSEFPCFFTRQNHWHSLC